VGKTKLQLLPHELRKLRELLLSHNTLFDTMMWTIIIVSVKAFLRSDEGPIFPTRQELTRIKADKDAGWPFVQASKGLTYAVFKNYMENPPFLQRAGPRNVR
jgi:hypothetical protein